MTGWRCWAIGVAVATAQASGAFAQPVPDFVDHPLGLLDQNWVRPDPSNNGTPITFFGVDDLDFRCRASPGFMVLAEAVALSIVYYSYAQNAFRGDFSTGRPGYAIDHQLDDSEPISAINLLKHIDQDQLMDLVHLAANQLTGRERELAQAALAALLGRYQPTIDRLDELGDTLPLLLQQFEIPNYDYDVIQQSGLPRDGDPCFSSVFYFNLTIGDQTSYAAVRSMDHFLNGFWVRRYAEGSHRLVEDLLLHTQETLQENSK